MRDGSPLSTGGETRPRVSYFGADGKPCLVRWRVPDVKVQLRRAGKPDQRVLLWRRRQALSEQGGDAGWKATYNERGNATSRSYFDQRGRRLRPVAVQVREVMPKGKAEALGLHARDVIVRYGGQHYTEVAKLISAIKAPGEKPRELVVRRDGKEISYQVTPGLLGVMLGTLYAPVAPDSPSSDKPVARPAAPSSTNVPPGKKDDSPRK